MNPLRQSVTRRTTLRLIGGGIAGVALAAYGGITQVLGFTATEAATTSEPEPVFPQGGAGLFDVDPDQGGVSQDPNVVVSGDVAMLPLDMEL
jgi:hypothetical protein